MARIILRDIIKEILMEASSSGGITGTLHGQSTVTVAKVSSTIATPKNNSVKSSGDSDTNGDSYDFNKYNKDNRKYGTSHMLKKS